MNTLIVDPQTVGLDSSLQPADGATTAPVDGTNVVGFRRAQATRFDATVSQFMDATQVLGCQLMDEVVRDLLGSVSHYNIPSSATCAEFYAWIDNAGTAAVGKHLASFEGVLAAVGLNAVPDNMAEQLAGTRDAVAGVLRAAFDHTCADPATTVLTKDVIVGRLKELQGMLCGMRTAAGAGGPWPKFEKDPLTGAQTIVTKDGTRIRLNLDNSADNTNNIANMMQDNGGGGKLDPNVLAALLLAAAPPAPLPYPPDVAPPIGMDVTMAPAVPATIDTTLLTDASTALPTAAPEPVHTMFGLGPIGLALVSLLLVVIAIVGWYLLRKKPGGGGSGSRSGPSPRNVPLAVAETASPLRQLRDIGA